MRVSFAPVVAVAAFAAAALSGCSLLGGTSVEDLQVTTGECISDPSVADEGSQEVGALPVIDCAEPHYGEVYYTEDLTADEYAYDIMSQAEEICLDQFEGWMGLPYEESDYYITSMSPTSGSWDMGDRQVACLVVADTGGDITGSLKGAAA